MKHFYLIILLITTALGISSCSDHDYTNAIPSNSTALIEVGAADFIGEQSPFGSLFMPFVDQEAKRLKGTDLTRDIYIFASGNGDLGMCAPLSNSDELNDFIIRLENLGVMKNHTEFEGKDFYTCKEQWVVGYDDNTLLVMGPVTGADAEARLMRRMAKLMNQGDEQSIKNSMLWKHLEERTSPIRMVAQASALPEQVAATVMLGAPKGTDADDVLLEADMTYDNGTLTLSGGTCSYNPNIKQSLKQSQEIYRPITVDWQRIMGDTTIIGVFMNVSGEELMPHLQKNRALGTMLMGTEAFDRIRSNNGDIAILLTPKMDGKTEDLFNTRVLNLPPGKKAGKERLVVAINVEAMAKPLSQATMPFLGKIKRIIYNMKEE